MRIVQVIYVSTAAHECTAEEIRLILAASVTNNLQQHVTGMLLYSQGSFLQVLEGEESDVDETMARITSDPRHHSINVLTKSTIAAREFDNWSMGFRGISPEDAATWPGYAPFFKDGFDAAKIGAKPGLALEILNIFAAGN
jgi:hypothetical protein